MLRSTACERAESIMGALAVWEGRVKAAVTGNRVSHLEPTLKPPRQRLSKVALLLTPSNFPATSVVGYPQHTLVWSWAEDIPPLMLSNLARGELSCWIHCRHLHGATNRTRNGAVVVVGGGCCYFEEVVVYWVKLLRKIAVHSLVSPGAGKRVLGESSELIADEAELVGRVRNRGVVVEDWLQGEADVEDLALVGDVGVVPVGLGNKDKELMHWSDLRDCI